MKTATRKQGNYGRKIWSIDAKNRLTIIILQVVGLIWAFIFGYFLYMVTKVIRPEWHWNIYDVFLLFNEWLVIVIFIAIGFLFVWLHEITHGIFFLLFTGKKPKIAFSVFYASCAAPGWYLPTGSYLITTLAPFILLTMFGIIALKFVPLIFIPYLLFVLLLNGGGSIGDIWVAIKTFWYSRRYNLMITDWGSGCAIYTK